jgi:uncharacterized membrane protein
MTTTHTNRLIIALIVLAAVVGAYLYPSLPDEFASHWNVQGEVDGTMSKFWGVFLAPLLMVFMYLLYLVIPRLDPLKANIEAFRPTFNLFMAAISAFLFYLFVLTLSWNSGVRFDMTAALLPGIAVIVYVAGVLMERSKRSWFIGLRTPWTLSDDVVWEKANRLTGLLFKWSALLIVLGAIIGGWIAMTLVLIPLVGSALWGVVYSYLLYRKRHP